MSDPFQIRFVVHFSSPFVYRLSFFVVCVLVNLVVGQSTVQLVILESYDPFDLCLYAFESGHWSLLVEDVEVGDGLNEYHDGIEDGGDEEEMVGGHQSQPS